MFYDNFFAGIVFMKLILPCMISEKEFNVLLWIFLYLKIP